MRKTLYILILIKILYAGHLAAQELKGVVYTTEADNKKIPLPGATLRWEGTGKGTTTNLEGRFTLQKPDSSTNNLIINYIGHKPDTVKITTETFIEIGLTPNYQVKEVIITEERSSTFISRYNTVLTEVVTSKELLRAACCNLSESFETNASIDVNFTDAITGAKQIRMLGLDGVYTQMLQENMPGLRGLASSYGLTFIPGTWIESIQITKGAGSVVNGYESMAGQINLELIKPMEDEKLLFNAYLDEMSRSEVNLNMSHIINDKWSTGVLLHADGAFMHTDRNKDGFLDAPLQRQFNALNRWNYNDGRKWESQFGISGTYQNRQGGQTHFDKAHRHHSYGIGVESRRGEAFAKLGRIFPKTPYKSFGSMLSVTRHEQNSYFGLKDYNARQSTLYGNFIYQSIISNTFHKIKIGTSFLGDIYNEKFTDSAFKRNELVPGAFTEYAYGDTGKFSLVTGLRADYHNIFGLMITPRVHARLALGQNTIMRASAGKGYRTPNIWMENSGLWASSRKVIVLETPKQEQSWNYGGSIIHNFQRNKQKGYISADYFHTRFISQVITDVDAHPQEVRIYNLAGKSFANSYQAEAAYDVLKNLNLKIAYKVTDVKATYGGELLEKPLVPQNRFLATAQYHTRFKKWIFDVTQVYNGKSRLPNTGSNPEIHQRAEYSTGYYMTNLQVTRNFKKFSVYAGSENMFDFRQPNPIVSADNPFGPYFDASMIWAPVDGRRIYAGIRYKLER